MNASRTARTLDALLRYKAGVRHDKWTDEACRQLVVLWEQRDPWVLQAGCTEERRQELLDSFTKILADDYTAQRLLDTIEPLEPEPEEGPRGRILFLNALPRDTESLQGGFEHNAIREALSGPEYLEKLALRSEWGVRIGDLQRYLLDHKPEIVHFSGHADEDGIVLTQNNGRACWVSGEQFAALFGIIKGTRCMVLNACLTSKHAESIARAIGSAVSWPKEVPDRAAIVFAKHFYQALARGCTLREAFELGRWQVEAESSPVLPEIFGDSSLRFVNRVK